MQEETVLNQDDFEVGSLRSTGIDLSVVTADNSCFEPVMDIIEDIKVGLEKQMEHM